MAILSIIVLLCFVLLLWVARKRHSRLHWLLSSIATLIAWLGSLFMLGKIPITTSISIWRPENIFPTPLAFSFNEITSLLGLTVLAMIVTITFIEPGLGKTPDWIERSFLLIYFSISIAALLVKNILTVITMWMLMDSAVFLYLLPLSERFLYRRRVIGWYLKGLLSILLLISTAGINLDASLKVDIINSSILKMTPLFILGACLLRLPWIRISLPRRLKEQEVTDLELAFCVLPSVAALGLVERLFRVWNDQQILQVSHVIGGIMVVAAMLMLFFGSPHRIHRVGYLIYLCWGITLLIFTNHSSENIEIITGLGYLIVFIPLMTSTIKIFETWQHVITLFAILTAVGIPGTPGYHLGEMTIARIRAGESVGMMILVLIGMGVLAYGVYHSTSFNKSIPNTREKLAQLSYSLGLIVLPLSGMIIGIKRQIEVSINGGIFTLSAGMIFGFLYLIDHKIDFIRINQFHDQFLAATRGIRVPYSERIISIMARLIRSMSVVFEGETGILWILVILQILILAFGRLIT